MMEHGFWQLLRSRQDELTKSGRRVAEYLTLHAEEAQYLSISALAKECGVAEATIFRFCRALGFEGYNEMKIALAQANANPTAPPEPGPGADTASLCGYAAALVAEAVNAARTALDPGALDAAAALLLEARQVYCFGQGSSLVLAADIWARFTALTTRFHTAGDSHTQAMTASLLGPEDAVLFVSASGATRDMMETLRLAKSGGAKIVLLTRSAHSPGAALADVTLVCGGQDALPDSGGLAGRIAMLYVAEVLILRISTDRPELTDSARHRTARALAAKRL